MKTWRVAVIIVFVVGWIFLVSLVIIPRALHNLDRYSGTSIFNTEQEYNEFKLDLKNRITEGPVVLDNYSVLASEPPIIVKFEVKVPYDYDFPYGKIYPDNSREADIISATWVSLLAGVVLVAVPIACLKEV